MTRQFLLSLSAAVSLSIAPIDVAAGLLSLPGRVDPAGAIAPILATNQPVYHVARAAAAPVIDGQPDEWKAVPAMRVDQRAQAGGQWDGPADLSGTLKLLWDDQAL